MKHATIAIATMIWATVLAPLGAAQQPGPEAKAGQARSRPGRRRAGRGRRRPLETSAAQG